MINDVIMLSVYFGGKYVNVLKEEGNFSRGCYIIFGFECPI